MRFDKRLMLVGVIAVSGLLSGCAPILVGGAAITSATVMTDRRSTGSIVNDEVLEKRVAYEIQQAIGYERHHISVTSYDGKVLLSGEVASEQEKMVAQRVASQSVDVASVLNELAVMDPSSVPTRISDSMLATKVRSTIIATKQISLNQMKVTVERGIVYLMGIVTAVEADTASRTAAEVSGVQQVVACFSVESEEQVRQRLKDLQTSAPADEK
ncbi:MAG: BON domain-containing protein [Sutterella sp.]|nr:BON domain-containing protein [Sutterella sp.]